MNISTLLPLALLIGVISAVAAPQPLGTQFNWTGLIIDTNGPVSGQYSVRFSLSDDDQGANVVYGPDEHTNVLFKNGVAAVAPNFGSNVFNGARYWLVVQIRRETPLGSYETLNPPQEITAAPYSLYAPGAGRAAKAGGVDSNAVHTAGLQNGAVTGEKISPQAVDKDQLKDEAVDGTKIKGGSIGTSHLGNEAVDGTKIKGGSIGTSHLGNEAVDGTKIKGGSIGTSHLGNEAVDGTKIKGGSIATGHLAPDAVDGTKIKGGSIATAHLANGAVGSTQLAAGAVTTTNLADGAVTAPKLLRLADATLLTTFSNPTPANSDYFGATLAGVGADRVLIGAPLDNTGASDAGAAYLVRTDGTLLITFANPAPAVGDVFGTAVATVGANHVLIGAYRKDTGAADSGSAYLFSTNGTLVTTFANPTPAAADFFGITVAGLGPDRVLIGAQQDDTGGTDSGAAYLFKTNGMLLATFTNPTPANFDNFGDVVTAMGADKVLIAAALDDTGAADAGAVYLFNTNGTLLTTFTNPAPATDDRFGASVAAMGVDKVLIGAYQKDTGAANAGAAYLYSISGVLLTTFTNPTPATDDGFGVSVAAMGTDKVLIGAYQKDTGAADAGVAYVFSTDGTLLATVTNPAPAIGDGFGSAVAALGADRVLIGANADDTPAANSGTAYLFSVQGPYSPGVVSESVRSGGVTSASLAPGAVMPANLADGAIVESKLDPGLSSTLARLNANQTSSGVNTFTNAANSFVGSFTGNGGGLTNLPAGNLVGAIADERLSANVPLLNANQTFSGANTFGNAANSFSGSGAALTSLNANNLAAGTLPAARLAGTYSSALILNNPANSFAGAFSGNGAALTALNADNLANGTVADVRLSPNVARLNADQTFAGSASFQGNLSATGKLAAAQLCVGQSHTLSGLYSSITGGVNNTNESGASFVGSGNQNSIAGSSSFAAIVGGLNNRIETSATGSAIGGGSDNLIQSPSATISGGASNRIQTGAASAKIGGGTDNAILTGSSAATISGGEANVAGAVYATVGGGRFNTNGGLYGTTGGGYHNVSEGGAATIAGGTDNRIVSSGSGGVISGGQFHLLDAEGGVISGGRSNAAHFAYSTVSGGFNNQAGERGATVAGGSNNVAAGPYSAVAGGRDNQASGELTFTGGGGQNTNGGPYGVIVGGFQNLNNGIAATVSGGYANSATGGAATVPGGNQNSAGGDNSFAAGHRAKANHAGTFVWADSTDADVASTDTNQFIIRASGGVWIGNNSSPSITANRLIDTSSGAHLTIGGMWIDSSDRNAKEHFTPLDGKEALARVIQLPVSTWNYKAEDPSIRHAGPVAQDFHAAFGLGQDDRHIAALDANGVALAAIQGLNQKLEAEIKQKEAKVSALEQRLAELEKLVNSLARTKGGAR